MKTGYNGLFIPGPTNIPERIMQAMTLRLEDMRAPDFGAFTLTLLEDLKKVFKTKTGQPLVYPASGTGGWESTLTNTLNPGDKILCSAFGQFSHLWCDMCARLGFEVVRLDVEWGKGVPVEEYQRILSEDKDHTIKAVLACHNETATGVASDIAGVRKALDAAGHPALLFVDGVSAIGSLDFRMDEWGVDVVVSGSQKGFMLPTGLAIICISEKAMEAHKSSKYPRCFFSWEDMANSYKTGYFPYTPATTVLRGLRASLDMIFEEGLENVFARHTYLAAGVRKAVLDGWGMQLCAKGPEWYSDTVSAIVVPEGHDAAQVITRAYERYNCSLGSGLSKVAGKVFRIGHLGWLNEIMVLQAVAAAEMAMKDTGIPVELGSGVAAAQAHFIGSNRAAA